MTQSSSAPAPFVRRWIRWFELRPWLALTLLTLATLGPFVAKPFNMDEPLFLWAAKHIQIQPANPYDFTVNWYGIPQPMWHVTKNPPLACYYLALSASMLGWSEAALHSAFLIPALAVIIGTYRLARIFCDRPIFAAITTLFTPVFLISSTSVMCDTMMLAFWVWAVMLWVEGLPHENSAKLFGSAVLMLLAACTKYYGGCLIPLLIAYSFFARIRIGKWAGYFAIPVIGLIAYQWVTFALYGQGLLSDAGSFAAKHRTIDLPHTAISGLTALAFTGGCSAIVTFLLPWLWQKRTVAILIAATLLFVGVILATEIFWAQYGGLAPNLHGLLGIEVVLWAIGGAAVLGLASAEAWQRRNASSYLLAMWVWGTFLFAAFLNWTLNGRSILPMAPAVAILLARRLTANKQTSPQRLPRVILVGSVLAGVLALLVTRADYDFSKTARNAAEAVTSKYNNDAGTLWFEGHWGWQYYMEQFGAKAIAADNPPPPDGDLLAVPANNTNLRTPNPEFAHVVDSFSIDAPGILATSHNRLGAGFYSAIWGPLPFAFGTLPAEKIDIFIVARHTSNPARPTP